MSQPGLRRRDLDRAALIQSDMGQAFVETDEPEVRELSTNRELGAIRGVKHMGKTMPLIENRLINDVKSFGILSTFAIFSVMILGTLVDVVDFVDMTDASKKISHGIVMALTLFVLLMVIRLMFKKGKYTVTVGSPVATLSIFVTMVLAYAGAIVLFMKYGVITPYSKGIAVFSGIKALLFTYKFVSAIRSGKHRVSTNLFEQIFLAVVRIGMSLPMVAGWDP